MNKENLAKAVRDTQNGESEAFSRIVKATMQRLYRVALAILCNHAEAEDLMQETYLSAYLHLSSLRDPEHVEGWLLRILKNKAYNKKRQTGYDTESIESEKHAETLFDPSTPEARYLEKESLQSLKDRLEHLSPTLKETATLYFLSELSMEAIAAHLNLPLGTVKRRIHDAREKLKKENPMSQEKSTLSDGYVTELEKKIKELEQHNHTGTPGFHRTYDSVKELIGGLQSPEDVKNYRLQSTAIATDFDSDTYAAEAFDTYRKYGEVSRAASLHHQISRGIPLHSSTLRYYRDRILPDLQTYPESKEKHRELGETFYHMAITAAHFVPEEKNTAKEYLQNALTEFKKTDEVSALYARATAAVKGLDLQKKEGDKQIYLSGTVIEEQNGNPTISSRRSTFLVYGYDKDWDRSTRQIFYMAAGEDYRYLPHTISLEPGFTEPITNREGKTVGSRNVESLCDTVETPAGVFENCLHLRITKKSGDDVHIWYKEGVGLVKMDLGDPLADLQLNAYEIRGGEGFLPLAKGNRWRYQGTQPLNNIEEYNEYIIERIETDSETGNSKACISGISYVGDKEEGIDDSARRFHKAETLCKKQCYEDAAKILREIVCQNRDRGVVDKALSVLEFLEEKLPYDRQKWRFCPSSAKISSIILQEDGTLGYNEASDAFFSMGTWGTRGEENRIFGAKPLRYLDVLCGTLWDTRWVPGYTAEFSATPYENSLQIKLRVEEGGTVETPAGVFENTWLLTLDCEQPGNREQYSHYFYNGTECGRKEFYFAKGVGIVRHKCSWGKHLESDLLLTDYRTVATPEEWMPIHIGNRWRYEEQFLSAENYIARLDYKVLSGSDGVYLLADSQMFTWRGSVDAYEEWKKTL